MPRLRRMTPTICAFHLGFGLEEASDLNRPQILERVGWPRHLEGNDRAWEAIGHFLLVMEDNGDIVNNNPGHGQDRWSKAQSG